MTILKLELKTFDLALIILALWLLAGVKRPPPREASKVIPFEDVRRSA